MRWYYTVFTSVRSRSNHWWLDCLLKTLFRLTSQNELPITGGFPRKLPSMLYVFKIDTSPDTYLFGFSFNQFWFCSLWPCDAIWQYRTGSTMVSGTKPLPEPMLTYHQTCSGAFNGEQLCKKCSRREFLACVRRLHYIFFIINKNLPGAKLLIWHHGIDKQLHPQVSIDTNTHNCVTLTS